MASEHARRRALSLCKKALPYLELEEPIEGIEAEDVPILRPIAPGLVCCYIVDKGEHYERVLQRHLTAARMSPEELHDVASRNLIDKVNEDLEMQALGDGAHGLILDGDFEASLMAIDPLWEHSLKAYATGDIIAVAPTSDVLAFGSDTPAGIAQLKAVAERALAETDRPLTDALFRRVNGAWEPYSVSSSSPPG